MGEIFGDVGRVSWGWFKPQHPAVGWCATELVPQYPASCRMSTYRHKFVTFIVSYDVIHLHPVHFQAETCDNFMVEVLRGILQDRLGRPVAPCTTQIILCVLRECWSSTAGLWFALCSCLSSPLEFWVSRILRFKCFSDTHESVNSSAAYDSQYYECNRVT